MDDASARPIALQVPAGIAELPTATGFDVADANVALPAMPAYLKELPALVAPAPVVVKLVSPKNAYVPTAPTEASEFLAKTQSFSGVPA